MSNVTFVYDQDSGLSAGLSGFINESGAYVFTISEAKYVISSGGAKSVEFSVETDDGRKANYLNVYTVKKDGSSNTHGVNMINAMMGCAGVKQLTMIKNEAGIDVAPEFVGRKLGLVLQKTLKTKDDGRETYNFDIRIPYFAQSQRTLQEHVANAPAETIAKMLTTLKDKDERKQGHAAPTHSGNYQGDEQFFAEDPRF
ncbi:MULTISPECIES: hypothetical protein [Yersinia]|uniref:DUF669 domain-containing protein n=1 Tax=Yersinia pekkanenii TaxID=1288385 RepID=A0A0T9NX15_9GAMM|nr:MULTISPECIES: hypothetical protein [Yersinia]CNH34159.1 Uncharacterised protein [Yersinia pekkanenii]CRY69731.1 Uncharacterised protein [Yersinia pekkanenii]VEE71631.1 Uncharacterised protein [Yersinia pseudotuberculosis]